MELLKDYLKTRVAYLKQKVHILEKEKEEFDKCFKKEKEQKEEYYKRANLMEKRSLEAQAELVVHRQRTHKLEEECKRLERKLRELNNEY